MNREEHIEFRMNWSGQQAEVAKKVQIAYMDYHREKSEIVFQKLLSYLDSYCSWYVRKTLYKTGCYNEENENTILQESRLAVWKKVSEDLESNTVRDNFAYYAFSIYRNQAMTIVRQVCKQRSKWGEDRVLSEPIDENGKTLGESLEYQNGNDDEKRKMYDGIFHIYCKTFMNSNTFPPRSLALHYARVLPHLLHINHDVKTIPDTKATSAKWAYEKMGDRTMLQLKEDSQAVLQNEVHSDLIWCDSFVRQLEGTLTIDNKNCILKDIVYTEVYDKGKIEDWADYMHKATVKSAKEEITKDSELLELVKEYVSRNDSLYQLMEGGRKR